MRTWLLRGLVLAVVHAAVQTAEAWVRAGDPNAVGWLRPTALGVLVGVAVLWAGVDGWLGREGSGMVWFFSALLAGPVGGVLGVIGQGVFVDDTGAEALPVAITGGAAFIALLVLVPAGIGLLIARFARPEQSLVPPES
ncbi:B-4DMT family transporter [Kutzneria sp. 744]|uniref:B-4DMT family transporter n=1 Tax=Kutzneria sp. (strain 744) TaxID=345341 RepID=UPI0006945D9C|nr:B-4DMT family transporter [Kutzneria sp. 744]